MTLTKRGVMVRDRFGNDKRAELLECPCGSTHFLLLWIEQPACGCDPNLSHLQCTQCSVTWCGAPEEEQHREAQPLPPGD